MKRSLLNKWIARLEDPETKQARGILQDLKGGFCCLGVLCDTVNPDNWICSDGTESYRWYYNIINGNGENSSGTTLPALLSEELGMHIKGHPMTMGEVTATTWEASLTSLNDSGTTLKEIAQILRERPLDFIKTIEEDE